MCEAREHDCTVKVSHTDADAAGEAAPAQTVRVLLGPRGSSAYGTGTMGSDAYGNPCEGGHPCGSGL